MNQICDSFLKLQIPSEWEVDVQKEGVLYSFKRSEGDHIRAALTITKLNEISALVMLGQLRDVPIMPGRREIFRGEARIAEYKAFTFEIETDPRSSDCYFLQADSVLEFHDNHMHLKYVCTDENMKRQCVGILLSLERAGQKNGRESNRKNGNE